MQVLEIVLLIVAYTLIIITLFLEVICYKRKIEALETIYFTGSLLALIVSVTLSYFVESFSNLDNTNAFMLIAMILVGLTTPLNALKERQHQIPSLFKKILIAFSLGLLLLVSIGHFIQILDIIQYIVVIFLGMSIVFSMLLIRFTKPQLRIVHREKIERVLAVVMLASIPIILLINYSTNLQAVQTKVGFTLPLVLIVLVGSKLWDDVQRLSLFKSANEAQDQNLLNYGLTKREKEIALLLVTDTTYRQISEQLFISLPTVKTHVSNIYRKCDTHNRIAFIKLITS